MTQLKRLRTTALVVFCLVAGVGPSPAQAKDAFEKFGDIFSYAIPAGAGIVSLSKGDFKGTLQFGLTYGATWGVTALLKESVDATRPNGGPRSFPSGHASSAFAGAAYLQFRYGWKYGVPAYALAAAVAYSRVDSDNHHWRDVIAGAALANVAAYFLTSRYEAPAKVTFLFDDQHDAYGVEATVSF